MFPTIVEILDLLRSPALQGRAIIGPKGEAVGSPSYIYSELPAKGVRQAIRTRDWKFILFYNMHSRVSKRMELYHLEDDPGEQDNLSSMNQELTKSFHLKAQEILTYLMETAINSKEKPVSQSLRDRLRSRGYAQYIMKLVYTLLYDSLYPLEKTRVITFTGKSAPRFQGVKSLYPSGPYFTCPSWSFRKINHPNPSMKSCE